MEDRKSYVVTAHKPTSVSHSVVGRFTGATDVNLVLAKTTRIEIHRLTPEGLTPMHDVAIYGRITMLEVFRPPSSATDLLFVCTQRYQFCLLAYDAATKTIVTRAHGNIRDTIGRMSDVLTSGNIDPDGRLIGMNLYEGYLKVIPMDATGKLSDAFNIRMDELRVIDVKFLFGCAKPTIAVLFEDQKGRHVKTYVVHTKEKELVEGPWAQSHVESSANLLIPVPAPAGGVLIVSQQMIVYHNGTVCHAISMPSTIIQVHGQVDKDGSRFLLADQFGLLQVVALQLTATGAVSNIALEVLGETSIASSLSYLDNGVVFVGSATGDSQLIKLLPARDPATNSYIEVLDTYVNIGPIVDFTVMDLDRQGQGQVVTCSGAYKDGSLRVIRNGIGINEQAATELPGIKGMWALRPSLAAEQDAYLVQSFVSETRVLGFATDAMNDGDVELAELEIQGLSPAKTLLCRNVVGDFWLQVTEHEARLITCVTKTVATVWTAPARITVAAANPSQLVLAMAGGVLVYFEVAAGQLSLVAETRMPHEIACLDVSPLASPGDAKAIDGHHWETRLGRASHVAVGLWAELSVSLLALPSLTLAVKQPLGGDVLPRSLLSIGFDGTPHLLVGMGDGTLLVYLVGAAGLSPLKRISLGSQPILLSAFRSKDVLHVFAASDRPTVIYATNGKLLFSNVNAKEVNVMCPFDSPALPDCLALASSEELTIGTIDDIQKLHVQSVPLGEWPRRVAHDPAAHALAVATIKYTMDETHMEEVEVGYVRLLDDQSFDTLHAYKLDPFEIGCALTVAAFDDARYFAVGTAYVHEEELEPHQGRILIFQVVLGKLVLVAEKEVKGAVYCLNAFQNKLLAGINSKTQLYKWSDSDEMDKELVAECGHHGHTLVLFMESRGDFIAVGDLMKSVSLLNYKALDGSVEEVAKDLNSNWMTAIDMLDDDHVLGAEADLNLFCVQRQSGATTDEERARLECVGEYHLGEFVNRFRHGSLVMQPPGAASSLFGTVSGMLGVVLPLDSTQYTFLHRLQGALTKVVKGVGGLLHKDWRMYESKRHVHEAKNFIDGDLVESFLDLPKTRMEQVVDLLNNDGAMDGTPPVTVDDVVATVEGLAQRH
ncbi:DNA damage-binding protein [Achlya hypogyna]|uniref:DNA damage-binding protein 1 n=1 Tax=Achlya hypogyna TaxID=1202772 RepID=A0A1V9ZE08_ACHHY|nr:DNA damage-binding protein [Achlya hypogyna]